MPVSAIAPTVSIQDLPSYITTDNFKLSCTAIGGTNVQFSYKKEGGSYTDFGGLINITSSPCLVQVGSGQISDQSKYYFKAILDGVVSDETSVTYDVAGPSPVTGYRKDDGGNNTIVIHWKNPESEDLAKVIIYRGETVDFSADSNHEIATVYGSPDSEMTYSINIPDTSKTYYYLIRAIDKAGNTSALVGDGDILQPSTSGDTVVSILPKEGSVLSEETTVVSEIVEEEETDKDPLSDIKESINKNSKQWLYTGLGLLFLGITLYFLKRKKA
jgi:hypothetical protein